MEEVKENGEVSHSSKKNDSTKHDETGDQASKNVISKDTKKAQPLRKHVPQQSKAPAKAVPKQPQQQTPDNTLLKQLQEIQLQIEEREKFPKIGENIQKVKFENKLTTFAEFNQAALGKLLQPPVDDSKDQIKSLVSEIGLSQNTIKNYIKVIETFNQALQNSELGTLEPRLHLIGLAQNELAIRDSHLQIGVWFKSTQFDQVQFYPALVAQIIRNICTVLAAKFYLPQINLTPNKLSFSFIDLTKSVQKGSNNNAQFRVCDIILVKPSVIEQERSILGLLANHDARFREMVLLLSYWAKANALIDVDNGEALSSYALTLMIVFFLQNTDTLIFPPLSALLKVKANEELKLDPTSNQSSTTELIVKFFTFYYNFKYEIHPICPRLGYEEKLITKYQLSKQKARDRVPFSNSYLCIEDPFYLSANCGLKETAVQRWKFAMYKMVVFLRINPQNCLQLLFDPQYLIQIRILPQTTHNLFQRFIDDIRWCHAISAQMKADESYSQDQAACICYEVERYFHNLAQRLSNKEVTYLKLTGTHSNDFVLCGKAFVQFLACSNWFTNDSKENYTKIIEQYNSLHPEEVLHMREQLIEIGASDLNETVSNQQLSNLIHFQMVTYKPIDSRNIHHAISNLENPFQQMEHLINNISLSTKSKTNLTKFVELINQALHTSPLASLGLSAVLFGSLANGLAGVDSDLDLVIRMNSLPRDTILDFETSVLLLRTIKRCLTKALGFDAKSMKRSPCLVPSRRCPIIRLQFDLCYPRMKQDMQRKARNNAAISQLRFNKCDISVSAGYGVYNSALLQFLCKLEPRFHQLTMLFRYWAKQVGLVNTECFSSYALTMMVTFYLQNTKPRILLPIETLQELAKQQPGKEPIVVHRYNFEFCDDPRLIEKTQNCQSTPELIVGFFHYYKNFNFDKQAICPRSGQVLDKTKLYQQKEAQSLAFRQSCICIEDPFVLDHNCGAIFQLVNMSKWKGALHFVIDKLLIAEHNCVQVLCDPNNFKIPIPKPNVKKQSKVHNGRHPQKHINK